MSPAKQHAPPATPGKKPIVDFNNLTLASLRKYKRVFGLRVKPTVSKAELVEHVSAHYFNTQLVPDDADGDSRIELDIIDRFVQAVRSKAEPAPGGLHTARLQPGPSNEKHEKKKKKNKISLVDKKKMMRRRNKNKMMKANTKADGDG